jgi:hypothetical protein
MRLLISLVLFLSLYQVANAADECLNIGVASGLRSSPAIGRITEAIFARAKSCAVIVALPQGRLNQIEAQDTLDGEALRVTSYLDQRPRLMLVPTPVTTYAGNLYWPSSDPEPKGPNVTIGVMAGQIWPKQAALARQSEILEVSSYDEMLSLTKSGRLQGFMMAAEAFNHFRAQDPELIRYGQANVAQVPLYLVVNKRHSRLVPKLDQAIKELLGNGYINQQLAQSSQ